MLPLRRLFRSRLLADRSQQRVQLHEGLKVGTGAILEVEGQTVNVYEAFHAMLTCGSSLPRDGAGHDSDFAHRDPALSLHGW